MIKKIIIGALFIIGAIYMFLPGATLIDQFAPLPDSDKSIFSGDTVQNPNIAAYFSNFRRADIVAFYRAQLIKNVSFGRFIPPIRINHRPEEAYQYIRDQQESTFLEQYTYPLRESFFVNGYEPLTQNRNKSAEIRSDYVSNTIEYRGHRYNSKTTIRLYFSKPLYRVIEYLAIWGSFFGLFYVSKRAFQEKYS